MRRTMCDFTTEWKLPDPAEELARCQAHYMSRRSKTMCDYIDIDAIKALVPEGWELVRVGVPQKGEMYLSTDREPCLCTTTEWSGYCLRFIVNRERWRAEKGRVYFIVDQYGNEQQSIDEGHPVDDGRYDIGNYYRTRAEAEAAAVRVRAAYRGEGGDE